MKKTIINNLSVLFLFILLIPSQSFAQGKEVQSKDISGVLLNEQGFPISGTLLFSSVGEAVTDKTGGFTIKVHPLRDDNIVVNEEGYEMATISVYNGAIEHDEIVLKKNSAIGHDRMVSLPFANLESYRTVTASNVIYGEELKSYPTITLLEALTGRVPGLVISKNNSQPGLESVAVSIRGQSALIYIDGVLRDASDLIVDEVEKVEIIKDFSGRAVLGIVAGNPIIYITTKKGSIHKTIVSATAQIGFRNAVTLPEYLGSYDYATLLNEARGNDGRGALYSEERLEGYRTGDNPLRYPDVNYYDKFVKSSTPYRSVNVNASGGDKFVQYFSTLDYAGTGGLESIGQESTFDRFKLRANVDLKFTDVISMNVNLSGTYGDSKFPNVDSGATPYDMFNNVLSRYPSNAHALEYDGMLFRSDNYPVNLINELKYGGYGKKVDLNTQNSTLLNIDLDKTVKGLSFYGKIAFDVNNSITNNRGGSEALYRHTIVDGEDRFERVKEKEVVTNLYSGADYFLRRTTFNGVVNYDRTFDIHELTLNGIYTQMLEDVKVESASYQPRKTQDLSFRANYAYDKRYVVQAELNYSGIMKLAPGKRFNLFSTAGAGWVISNESFLKDNSFVDYLKLYTTYGVMGIDNFSIPGYNQFYLHQTLWQNTGGWSSGVTGNYGDYVNIYSVIQQGSIDYKVRKRNHFNVGTEGEFLNKRLGAEVNYFYVKDFDILSLMESRVPSLFGTGGFLPATNFGKEDKWGVDAAIQYTDKLGAVDFSIGANAVYMRGTYLEVDEPVALDDYRKLAGKHTDLIWGYKTDGLFQSESDVNSYKASTPWGKMQPGDIQYVDYNQDGVIDAKDIHALEAHYPRLNYGVNFSLGYKGFKLFVVGKGVADGSAMLTSNRYFWINSETQNYSKVMQDRWPNTNDYPRLTSSSPHNYQGSSFWIKNASYFTLSNVELSYTMPGNSSLEALMKDTKFFVRGANLIHFSSLNSYKLNPEDLDSGISKYPHLRTITFGISAKF